MKKSLATERLILKVLDDSYAEQVLDYYIRNRDFLKPWSAKRNENYYTLEEQKRLLLELYKMIENQEAYKVWICKKEEPDRILGSVGLSNIVYGAFQSCHLGYQLDQHEQSKGFMTEAVREIVDYAFNEMGLHRIEANIMPRNKASLRVVEKLGFYHEGLALKYLKINGVWEDHIHMVKRNERLE